MVNRMRMGDKKQHLGAQKGDVVKKTKPLQSSLQHQMIPIIRKPMAVRT